ncbi:MAG: gliding motility lipoprotein GldJ [Candidatus Amoebophilus sp. 36-38]|nr:MAG: gliding motility lipoprotein GldJ [Candidatus Amoebophilus sp. 36-38]
MKKLSYLISTTFLLILLISYLAGCGDTKPTGSKPGKRSTATGIPFSQEDLLRIKSSKKQKIAPDMVYVEGGSTIMGVFGEGNVTNSPKKEVTVTSFYMKEREVVNLDYYIEYLGDLQRNSSDEEYKAALPNQNVWISDLGYNDPYVNSYSKEPGFYFYPVVGVTWTQANNYCIWLTKRMNSQQNEDENTDDQDDTDEVSTEEGNTDEGNEQNESSVLGYRLPTEAEWEYAARAMVGTQSLDFVQSTQRVYPWGDGLSLRGKEGEWKGKYLANFKRSKGTYKGVPGESNSSAPTTNVYQYPANDLGLYDMGGNVSEWVSDIYRPLSFQDFDDFNPIRRDDTLDPEKDYDQNNSLINNRARVYKGASWKDCAYWAQIGTRRFLDQDSSRATIGFRYAMTSMGEMD